MIAATVPALTQLDVMDDCDTLPFFPLNAPGMPEPGPDFIRVAGELGDPKPVFKGSGKEKGMTQYGKVLEQLYRKATYDEYFNLPVRVKGKPNDAAFVPGHRWGHMYKVEGPREHCEVFVLGKCPTRTEVNARRGFTDDASQLFHRVLIECGAKPEEFLSWYVTNLVKHINLEIAGTRLPAAWIKNCSPIVEQELRLVKPKFVLCLGAEASAYMLGDTPGGVAGNHGKALKHTVLVSAPGEPPVYHEFMYMTCVHPAAVSKNPARRPDLVGTLRRFLDMVHGNLETEGEEKVDHRVVYTEQQLAAVIDEVIADHKASGAPSQPIAVDCEWHGELWSSCHRPLKSISDGKRGFNPDKGERESWLRTFQFSHKPGFACSVVLSHGGLRSANGQDRIGLPSFVPSRASAVSQLKRLFTSTPDRQVRLVGHNLKADLPWVCQLDSELGAQLISMFDPPGHDLDDPDPKKHVMGWTKSRHQGGFDTMYAMHAIQEASERKLEIVAMNLCGVKRYDGKVQARKKWMQDTLKIKASDLQGYGEIPDEELFPYGNWDVDATIRVFHHMTRPGGPLDHDQYGNNCWLPFWLSQGKLTAEIEMEMEGMCVDHKRAEQLMVLYKEAGDLLLAKLRNTIGWNGFNPNSTFHTRTILFGPAYSGKINKESGDVEDPRPEGARHTLCLRLMPVKSSGEQSKPWHKIVQRREVDKVFPSTDKETLGILLTQTLAANNQQAADLVKTLRWYRFINRVLTSVLCPPDAKKGAQYDEDGDLVFEKGFMEAVEWDGRVRTRFSPVDTGRVASRDPNIQNLSKRREKDLKDILGSKYAYALRSMVTCPPGHVSVEADFTGAELMMMAVQSGSAKMVDHCQRANLDEKDPLYHDIHSNMAVTAFQLVVNDYVNKDGKSASEVLGLPVGTRLPATKSALKAIGRDNVRDIAKTIVFGLPYGRGDEAVVRAVEELGIKITLHDVNTIRNVIFGSYPELESFFAGCRRRVVKPGWMRTCFGRYRRFEDAGGQQDVIAEMERQAGNFPIQGGVADALSLALRNLRHYPGRYLADGTPRYRLCAQIHDAVKAYVRIQDLEWYIDKVLPDCLTKKVAVYACNLDGQRLPGRPSYHMGFEHGMYEFWGDKISLERGLELGIPTRFLPKPKDKK